MFNNDRIRSLESQLSYLDKSMESFRYITPVDQFKFQLLEMELQNLKDLIHAMCSHLGMEIIYPNKPSLIKKRN